LLPNFLLWAVAAEDGNRYGKLYRGSHNMQALPMRHPVSCGRSGDLKPEPVGPVQKIGDKCSNPLLEHPRYQAHAHKREVMLKVMTFTLLAMHAPS
jgi:hypothetical protein